MRLEYSSAFQKANSIIKSMVVSNLKGQYRYSYLGLWWQFITPMILVVLYYIVFTSVRAVQYEDYWLLLCTGIFPYIFMESAVISGSMCIVNNSAYVKKMNFPKQYIIYAHCIYNLIIFTITFTIITVLAKITGHHIDVIIILGIILMTALTFMFNIGTSLFLSAVVVYFRDLGHLISACSRLLFWATPTIYSIYEVSGVLRTLLLSNPMTYFVARFQDLVLYGFFPHMIDIAIALGLTLIALITGTFTFSKLKDGFAERI